MSCFCHHLILLERSLLSCYLAFPVKLSSLNIHGFGNDDIQRSVFDFAKQSSADLKFIFLQEILVAKPDAIASLKARWPGKSFWSPALSKQGRVALLVLEILAFRCLNGKETLLVELLVFCLF